MNFQPSNAVILRFSSHTRHCRLAVLFKVLCSWIMKQGQMYRVGCFSMHPPWPLQPHKETATKETSPERLKCLVWLGLCRTFAHTASHARK